MLLALLASLCAPQAAPALPVVPDGRRGEAPLALMRAERGGADPRGWVQFTLPWRGAPPPGGMVARRWRPSRAQQVPGADALEGEFEVQLDLLARAGDGSLGLESSARAYLATFRDPKPQAEGMYVLYARTSPAPPAAPLPESAQALRELAVVCSGPGGERYRARPFAHARLTSAGPVLLRGEGAEVAWAEEGGPHGAPPLPHGPLVLGFFECTAAGDLARVEVLLGNGFVSQASDSGWGAGQDFDPQAASSTLYLGSASLEPPETLRAGREAPLGSSDGRAMGAQRLTILSAPLGRPGEPRDWLPLESGACVVRSFSLAPATDRSEFHRAARCVGVVQPALDARGRELASWRQGGPLAGLPLSVRSPRARAGAEIGGDLAAAWHARAQAGDQEFERLAGLELERATLYGTTSGGGGIGSAWPEFYDALRCGSAAGLALLEQRWRDLSDRADCLWINTRQGAPRFGEPWSPRAGLRSDQICAPEGVPPLNFDVSPSPYLHAGFFDFNRARFEATPGYQAHLAAAGEPGPRLRWVLENKFPHDWQHASRYWPAFAAAWVLGSPSARTFVRGLGLAAAQARSLVPCEPSSAAHPGGKPPSGFSLLAAREAVDALGPGRGGAGAGRALAWILWIQANALPLMERGDERELLLEQLRAEVELLARARIPEWGALGVTPPDGKWRFPRKDAAPGESAGAWYVQTWEMALMGYGLWAARAALLESGVEGDLELAESARGLMLDQARFHLLTAWNEAAGVPFAHLALAPEGGGYPERFPPLEEDIGLVRGMGGDAYYAQDLAALLAAEGGDFTALERLQGLDPAYGESMGQLRAWLAEMGRLERR
jgi:hypothetical protein